MRSWGASFLGLLCASSVAAGTPAARFDEATRYDLEGKPDLAFVSYLAAADEGLPEAEFNVAVMLDSGRGVAADMAQAALWYARAASHGLPRAAYNLGQLYESGQGVLRNAGLARAWFQASKLPAASAHLVRTGLKAQSGDIAFEAPTPLSPIAGSKVSFKKDGVELVWTSRERDEPTQYYVELCYIDETGSHEVFSFTTSISSVFVRIYDWKKKYVWRVTGLTSGSSQYFLSRWSDFEPQ